MADAPKRVDIPAGELSVALLKLSKQYGTELVYRPEQVHGLKTHGAHGQFTTEQAVTLLLQGTPLELRTDSSGAMLIAPPTSGSAQAADIAPQASGTPSQDASDGSKEGKKSSSGDFRVAQLDQVTPGSSAVDKGEARETNSQNKSELEEIIVTAQKREEQLLSVPAPVTALLGSALARDEAVQLDDYASQVPGLNLFGQREGTSQLVLRGITTGASNSSTTATYIDDTPFGSSTTHAIGGSTALDLDPGSLQRVEVLRGPQGTLYGASALGGIIKYVTAPPSLTEFGGRVEVDGSTVDGGGEGYGVRALVDGPLVDNILGFTLSAFDRRDPGYIDNPILGEKNVNATRVDGGRAVLLWQPTSQFSVKLSVLGQDTNSNGSSDEFLNANLTPIDGGLKQFYYTNEPLELQSRLYNITLDYDPDWGQALSITSYQTERVSLVTDVTTLYRPLVQSALGITNPDLGLDLPDAVNLNKVSEEFRVASLTSNQLEWQGGLFFTRESSEFGQTVNPFSVESQQPISLPVDVYSGFDSEVFKEEAIFGDLTYHFTKRFDVLAGLRYSENQQDDDTASSGLLGSGGPAVISSSSDHSLTYLVTPKYQFDNNTILYARIASGYRPGGPNIVLVPGTPTSYKPDTLTNYEIGYKAALLDHTLTLEVSAFDIEWQHIQLGEVIGGVFTTGNGSNARSNGVEANGSWAPLRGLKLSTNLAYTHAYLTDPAPGINGNTGDQLPDSPRFAANLAGDYDFPITGNIGGFAGASFHYEGARVSDFVSFSPADFQRPVLPAYRTVDLRGGVNRGGLELEIYAKNLGNTHGLNYLNSENFNGYAPPYVASVIQPLTFGFSLREKF